nr:uncharacterized protein LOC117989767 [Maniola hyperantus]
MTSSMNFVLMVFGLVAVSLRSVHGVLTDEDRTKIHAAIIPFIAECTKEYGVTEDVIKEAKETGRLGSIDPCLMACVFQKTKLIDEEGLFDGDKAAELVQKYISSEEDQKKMVEIIEKCKSVNDEDVSDGEKGCERAKLIYECSIPFKSEFIKSRLPMAPSACESDSHLAGFYIKFYLRCIFYHALTSFRGLSLTIFIFFKMFIGKIFLFSFVLLNLRVHAENSDDLAQNFVAKLMDCTKDFPMTGDDTEELKNKRLPDTENMRCLFACAYKGSGMMDDQGKLAVEGINDQAQIYFADDADKLARAKDFTEACKSVNDVKVSDGNRGCDRAALIFECGVEKASQFGFGV